MTPVQNQHATRTGPQSSNNDYFLIGSKSQSTLHHYLQTSWSKFLFRVSPVRSVGFSTSCNGRNAHVPNNTQQFAKLSERPLCKVQKMVCKGSGGHIHLNWENSQKPFSKKKRKHPLDFPLSALSQEDI